MVALLTGDEWLVLLLMFKFDCVRSRSARKGGKKEMAGILNSDSRNSYAIDVGSTSSLLGALSDPIGSSK